MNGSMQMISDIITRINDSSFDASTEIVVAPPALYLLDVQKMLKPPVQVSAQNCFSEASGAFTGEISPNQLKDASIHWVILGHSERRSLFGDTDKLVADKVRAAINAGLGVIACIGESLEQREKNITMEVVERQLEAITKEVSEDNWKCVSVLLADWARTHGLTLIGTLSLPVC